MDPNCYFCKLTKNKQTSAPICSTCKSTHVFIIKNNSNEHIVKCFKCQLDIKCTCNQVD